MGEYHYGVKPYVLQTHPPPKNARSLTLSFSFLWGSNQERHPMKPHRLTLTNSLVVGYGLHKRMDVFSPRAATRDELESFHDSDYVDFLSRSVSFSLFFCNPSFFLFFSYSERSVPLLISLQSDPFCPSFAHRSILKIQLWRRLSCLHRPV